VLLCQQLGLFSEAMVAIDGSKFKTVNNRDRDQLTNMAGQARAGAGTEQLTVLAERGYFKSEEIRHCHEAGITPIVPKTVTSNATAAGRFGKGHFIYDAETNEYRCPAGYRLIWRFARVERGMTLHRY
jgi:transposase